MKYLKMLNAYTNEMKIFELSDVICIESTEDYEAACFIPVLKVYTPENDFSFEASQWMATFTDRIPAYEYEDMNRYDDSDPFDGYQEPLIDYDMYTNPYTGSEDFDTCYIDGCEPFG